MEITSADILNGIPKVKTVHDEDPMPYGSSEILPDDGHPVEFLANPYTENLYPISR